MPVEPCTSCDPRTGREDTEAHLSGGLNRLGLKLVNQKKKKVTQSAYYVEHPGETGETTLLASQEQLPAGLC